MNRIVLVVLTALAALILTGCVAPTDWNARIGAYTYHQAVMDHGPPVSSTTLKNGSTVAEWETKRSTVVVTPSPLYGPGFYYRRGYFPGYYGTGWAGYTRSYFPGQFLRLEFGPDGRLKEWNEYSK